MIPLKFLPKPATLTDELIAELTQKFQSNPKESVWNREDIKTSLLAMSFGKCCYCECKVTRQGVYVEVEHYVPKKIEPSSVLVWENLLPSCKTCNGAKSTYNTFVNPIVHPVHDIPKVHLQMKENVILVRNGSLKGKNTLASCLKPKNIKLLNDREEVCNRTEEAISTLDSLIKSYKINPDEHLERLIPHKLRILLKEGQPQSEFSATVASYVCNSQLFLNVKSEVQKEGLWTNEHTQLENILQENSLA